MNGVIGMTNLLLGTPLNETQKTYTKTVKTSADSLLAIINDILDFSKVEAGMLEMNAVDFVMALLMSDLGRSNSFRAHEAGLQLICPADPIENERFSADPGRIRQILNNLIGNAIKFTKKGQVAVHYKVLNKNESRTKLLIEVVDSGIGLTDQQQVGLFERFSQADGSTTRKYGGTGLGLAISKQLVELMGGEIGVKSVEGKGSTFWFTLDLANAETQAQVETLSDLSVQKVLVVIDNLTNRILVGKLLKNWGIEHCLVDNSYDALKILTTDATTEPYSIVLIDMQISEMSGMQLSESISKESSLSSIKKIMLTSHIDTEDMEGFKKTGFDAFLLKPIDQSVLYNTLLQVSADHATNEPQAGVTSKTQILSKFNAHVLVVEDNRINQMVAQHLLEEFGLTVDIAVNGEEALKALENTSYHLVFMDCQMPVMDGYDATRKIREPTFNIDKTRLGDTHLPIIAMTANTMEGDYDKCINAGMDDFIAKPVDPDKVYQLLQKWLTS